MPLRFWKKEKPEKGKEEEAAEEPKEKREKAAPAEPEAPRPAPEVKKPESKKPEEKAEAPARPPKPGEAEAIVNEAHAGLVDLGLTVSPTKVVFAKRVAAHPGGETAFVAEYRSTPYRAVTRVLIDWLGFRVSETFEPAAVLAEVNRRLSSFNLNVEMKDLSWLDKELNLRKAKLIFGEQERVVRFKDARDLLKGVNEMLAPRKIAFLELETWADDSAFLLVREPRWEKLADPELVVVKADQTAKGGECGECGAPVGKYWSDCPKCGAVFG
jgi:hypothetical protein